MVELARQPSQNGVAAYAAERERAWLELLNLVAAVDRQLCGGHLRLNGQIVYTLDEWVREAERWLKMCGV